MREMEAVTTACSGCLIGRCFLMPGLGIAALIRSSMDRLLQCPPFLACKRLLKSCIVGAPQYWVSSMIMRDFVGGTRPGYFSCGSSAA